MLDGGDMGGAMGGHAGAGGFGGSGGNVDGGASTAGQGHPGNRGRGRGRSRGNPHDGAWGNPNTVDPGLAAAMEDAYAQLQDAFGHNMPSVGYGRGFSRGSKGMPQHQRDSGWRAGQTLTDKYGNPVSLESLSFSRDDLLDDAKYETWAQQNPDKVSNMPSMLGGLLNSMGLPNLSGAMTPDENAWADSRWEGGPSDGPQVKGRRPNPVDIGGGGAGWLGIGPEMIRQYMDEQALSTEGGNNYDGRYERRNPRAYGDWEGGDNPF